LDAGRKDDSGDFTKGAELSPVSISKILDFLSIDNQDRKKFIIHADEIVNQTDTGQEAIKDLTEIDNLLEKLDYLDEISFDSSIVRGLEYYTGTIFEANLQFQTDNDKDLPIIGSIGGGGRYDNLISRFRKDQIGAVGFSIGISRLVTILQMAEFKADKVKNGPILVLKMDNEYSYSYYQIAKDLRDSNISAEVYVGSSGMKAQMKYADKRRSPIVIIEGTVEREKGIVTIKNLIRGKEISKSIDSREDWIKNTDIQFEVNRAELVETISKLLEND
jgi:histidyl-tRNA synthetase